MLRIILYCLSCALLLAVVLSFSNAPHFQDQDSTKAPEVLSSQSSFSISTNLVLLNVSLRRPDGAPVPGLTRSDFLVYEEGEPQIIEFFQEQNSPLQLMLLLDTSSSMKGDPLAEARRAATEMISRVPEARIALMTFSHHPRLVEGFSTDQGLIYRAVERTEASGGTALYDAISQALGEFEPAKDQRQILVLLSDGKDEDSFSRYPQVERKVQSSLVTIYSIGEYSESERSLYQEEGKYYRQPEFDANLNPVWILDQLSTLTGGLSFFPRRGENLTPIFKEIFADLQSQYLLGYEVTRDSKESEFRRIEVRVKEPDRFGKLTLRTRSGYRLN